jgi:hypothetical protein
LKRQGKRRNGRWEYGQFTESGELPQQRMAEVGLILDVADRAGGLGDEFDMWASLPPLEVTGWGDDCDRDRVRRCGVRPDRPRGYRGLTR